MDDIAIRAEGLGKRYRIGAAVRYKALRDTLADALYAPFRRAAGLWNGWGAPAAETENHIWALKDVSFEVRRGEVVGVIGRNGAGKSTLLRILSRITEPTEGRAVLHGRVGSLLEVGTGFHPELTGRENVFLNGAILGMRRAEIAAKFDEMVAFAEVEKFIDTPVKHYSSGMFIRLAFAVAAHMETEILLVDEVLAVGDAAFQKKCLGKMDDVAKAGRTVLFVSHNMGAIGRICARSIWIDDGQICMNGNSSDVVNKYQGQSFASCGFWARPESEIPGGDFAFMSVMAGSGDGQPKSTFAGDEPISIEMTYVVRRPLSGCQIGVRVYNSRGLTVFSTSDADTAGVSAQPKEKGNYMASFKIPGLFLAPGIYRIFVGAHLPNRTMYDLAEQTVVFEVFESGSLTSLDGRLGEIAPLIPWSLAKLGP